MLVPYDLDEHGGVRHHAFELAAALRELGDDVTVIGPAARDFEAPHCRGFHGIVSVPGNGSDNRLGLLVSPGKVWRFFQCSRFDVVHLHEPLQPALPYWALSSTLGVPHVATFHAHRERTPKLLATGVRLCGALQAPFIDRAVAVSAAAAASARLAWRGPLSIVPNGVSTTTFRPATCGSPQGTARLLFVGRLTDERKGLRHFLEAYRSLRRSRSDVVADVVGGGDATSLALDGLTYRGALPLSELVALYQRCDVFVAPSTGQESSGIVLLEAMACGAPVVCSDIDGYRETVSQRGALLVPPADPGGLRDAISFLLDRPALRAAMAAQNRARALSFDWSHIAPQIRREYLAAIVARERPRVGAVRAPAAHSM